MKIVNSLEGLGLLIDDVNQTVENKTKEQSRRFLVCY